MLCVFFKGEVVPYDRAISSRALHTLSYLQQTTFKLANPTGVLGFYSSSALSSFFGLPVDRHNPSHNTLPTYLLNT